MSAIPAQPHAESHSGSQARSDVRSHVGAQSHAQAQGHSGEQYRGPNRASERIYKLAAQGMRKFIVVAPLSVVGGLLAVLIANPVITNTYDDPAAARKLFFLATTVSILSIVSALFAQGVDGSEFTRTRGSARDLIEGSPALAPLLAAGMARRKILVYHLLRSALYALAAALVTLLLALALSAITGDFSGQLFLDGVPKANLWALPVLAACGSMSSSWFYFMTSALSERFRWYVVLVFFLVGVVFIAIMYVLVTGIADNLTGEDDYLAWDNPAPWNVTILGSTFAQGPFANALLLMFLPGMMLFANNVTGLIALITCYLVFISLPISWLSLRKLPIKK